MNINSKTISNVEEIIKIFKSNDEYELELKYDGKITKETFDSIITEFESKRLEIKKTKTLDIIFIHNKINYRITIDDSQVAKYASTNDIKREMIKEILNKQKITGYKPVIIKDKFIKINMKEEIPVTDETLIKKLLIALKKSSKKGYRYKNRTSFVSANGLFQYDFTEVSGYLNGDPTNMLSNVKFSMGNVVEDKTNYELEIEIINRDLIRDTKTTATDFLTEGYKLFNLINDIKTKPTIKPLIKKSSRRSLRSSNKSYSKSDMNWILPNRIGYSEKLFKTFRPENYQSKSKLTCACDNDRNCDVSSQSVSLFPQQRLIKDYVQYNSPYRGALLYHELGSGKSGASIAAAEGYINKKKMFVLSPASLAVNYENEILKISSIGLNLKKDWKLVNVNKTDPEVIKILLEKYAINAKDVIKKNGLVWIPLYEDDIPNATIIKSTVSQIDKPLVDAMISHIIRNRYTFISYNGLNKNLVKKLKENTFNNSFVIIDEVHNFASRIVNGSSLARDVYLALMDAQDCKLILLSGTPIINNPYEIATIVNLIRGYMTVYEIPAELTEKDLETKLKSSNLMSMVDDYHIDNQRKKLLISLLPKNYKRVNNEEAIIKKDKWSKDDNAIIDEIKTLLKLTSDKTAKHQFSALPTTLEEFNNYFLDMTDDENPTIKNQDLFMRRILGSVSYYSISGSELFPKRNNDETRYLEMTDNQFKRYVDVRDIERKMDMKKAGVMENKTSVYRAFSRMVCNFSFPENIKRLYPNDIKKELKKEMDQDEDEEIIEKRKLETEPLNITEKYERNIKNAINELIEGDYLTYDNVKNELSPKFASMYTDIETSPGSVLVYSQFRTVEGLGLFSEFLIKNGYRQIDIKKVNGEYLLTDPSVFNRSYDNKRFIIFSADKEKTRYLMNLFNGDFKNLPPKLIEALPDNLDQLYGKLVKIFCITASGAEGLSLKNVRRVLITEPYWNNIRTDQVIGRAIRSCSHETLPLKDRNVTVYRYIMKFTKAQLEKNFTIQTLDNSITTDEHIQMMANKKMNIVNTFLQMLKTSSFDCIINSSQNKPILNGYKCYNWALGVDNNDLSYTANIKDDYKIMKHKNFQIARKNKGKVIMKNGVKYVELNGKIYNYYSYVNAHVLIPEEI